MNTLLSLEFGLALIEEREHRLAEVLGLLALSLELYLAVGAGRPVAVDAAVYERLDISVSDRGAVGILVDVFCKALFKLLRRDRLGEQAPVGGLLSACRT